MRFLRRIQTSILMLAITTSIAAAQDTPPGWHWLLEIQITEFEDNAGNWWVEKEFPPELVELAPNFEISGFYLPMQAEPFVTEFILVPEDTDCPFCGASGYGMMLEVHMRHPLGDIDEGTLLKLTGQLELMDDPGTYQSARLLDARTRR